MILQNIFQLWVPNKKNKTKCREKFDEAKIILSKVVLVINQMIKFQGSEITLLSIYWKRTKMFLVKAKQSEDDIIMIFDY